MDTMDNEHLIREYLEGYDLVDIYYEIKIREKGRRTEWLAHAADYIESQLLPDPDVISDIFFRFNR